MTQPLLPSTISTQSGFVYFLTVKGVVRKFGKSDGLTESWCFDKAVLAQGGGGGACACVQIESPAGGRNHPNCKSSQVVVMVPSPHSVTLASPHTDNVRACFCCV